MFGKHRLDLARACFCQMNMDHPAVFYVPLAADVSVAFEVVDDGGEVARALQHLAADLTLRHRTKVIQGLQHAKLRIREVAGDVPAGEACKHRVSTAGKLDERIQGAPLSAGAFVMGGHIKFLSTSNSLMSKYYQVLPTWSRGFDLAKRLGKSLPGWDALSLKSYRAIQQPKTKMPR